jgi:hypothetical protein
MTTRDAVPAGCTDRTFTSRFWKEERPLMDFSTVNRVIGIDLPFMKCRWNNEYGQVASF